MTRKFLTVYVCICWITPRLYTRGRCQPDAVPTESIIAILAAARSVALAVTGNISRPQPIFPEIPIQGLAAKERYTTRSRHIDGGDSEIDARIQRTFSLPRKMKRHHINVRRLRNKL